MKQGRNLFVAATAAEARAAAQPWQAIADVIAERRRQIEAEGWTAEHDDAHGCGQMALAGAAYAAYASAQADGSLIIGSRAFDLWPWQTCWWKPKDQRRNLVRAAALLVAEIERLDRKAARP